MLKKLFGLRKPKWEVVRGRTPRWVQKQLNSIYRSEPAGDPGEVVVYQVRGKRFRYKIEIPVTTLYGQGHRLWGDATVYRKPRMRHWKKMNS